MKKWMCLLLGLCVTATMLASCGEDDDKTSSLASTPGGTSSVAPVAISPSPTPEQTAKAVKVKSSVTDGLNVRSKASTDGDVLGLAKSGSKLALLVEDENNGWYQISYEGKTAYVSAEYVDVVEVTLDEYNKLKSESGSSSASSKDEDSEASSKPEGDDPQSSGSDDEDGE